MSPTEFALYIDGVYCGSVPGRWWVLACLVEYGQEFEPGYEFAWELRKGQKVIDKGVVVVADTINPRQIMPKPRV